MKKAVTNGNCLGCLFEDSQECWNNPCGVEEIFIEDSQKVIYTPSGWLLVEDTGKVVASELDEDFGPAPIHWPGDGSYWYLDMFDNPQFMEAL